MANKEEENFDHIDFSSLEEEENFDHIDFSSLEEEEGPSQLEAVSRAAGEDLTMGFLDELMASFKAKGGAGRLESLSKPIKDVAAKEKEMMRTYMEASDKERARTAKGREKYPVSTTIAGIAGGTLPAIASGGLSRVAGITKALGKEAGEGALKQATKEGLETGAKYGATAGLGYSEAETPFGVAADVAEGTVGGAVLGTATPIALKGAGAALKGTGKKIGQAVEFITPESGFIKAAYQYGKQGKKIAEEVIDDDLIDTASSVYDRIIKAKKDNNLRDAKKILDDLGYKVDSVDTINKAIEDLEKIAREDILEITNKELLPKLKRLAGQDIQGDKLMDKATKQAIKKKVQASGLEDQAVIKAEKQLAKDSMMTGDSLETVRDTTRAMDDMELPFDTSKGQFSGASGKFKDPMTQEEYAKTILSDTTDYQPQISKILGPDGRPIIKTRDAGSGRITAIVGDVEDKMTKDLSNLTISDAENMRKQLNLATKLARAQGAGNDPAVIRGRQLAAELKELTDDLLMQHGDEVLINKRARMSDLLSAEEILGIEGKLKIRGDLDKEAKIKEIADHLGFQKGFKSRQESHTAKRLLGDDILDEDIQKQFELLKKVNQIVGRESQENISKAGLYKKAVGDLPNAIGRAGKAVSDIAKKASDSPIGRVANNIGDLPEDTIRRIHERLATSESKGMQSYAAQLRKALESEGPVKNAMIWSLSQQPAFRNMVKEMLPQLDDEMKEDLQFDDTQAMVPFKPEEYIDGVERMPASMLEGRNLEAVKEALAKRESSNNPKAINSLGYTGKYQFGAAALEDLGYLKPGSYKKYKNKAIKMPEQWTSKDGMTDMDTFMGSEGIQDAAMSDYLKVNYKRLKRQGVPVDEMSDKEVAGLLSASHLVGTGGAEALHEGGDSADAYGSKASEYRELGEKAIEAVEKEIDRVNQQQSSGDDIPMNQLDGLLNKVNQLNLDQETIDELENEAVAMESYSDGARLKDMIRKLSGLS